MKKRVCVLLLISGGLWAQFSPRQAIDFSALTTKPVEVGLVLPSNCSSGAFFFKSDEPAGLNLFACTATDTWTRISGSTTIVAALPATCEVGGVYSVTGAGAGVYLAVSTGPCAYRLLPNQGDPAKDSAIGMGPGGGSHKAWIVAPASDPAADWALALPAKPTATSVMVLPATTNRTSNDSGVPAATSETVLWPVETAVGTPGSNTKLVTEKAVRDAIGLAGVGGTNPNIRWYPAGFCRADGGTGDTLWGGSAQALGWSFSSGLCGTSLAAASTDWTSTTVLLPTNWNSTFTIAVAHTLDPSQTGTYTLAYSIACFAWADITQVNLGTGITHGTQVDVTTNMSSAAHVVVDSFAQTDLTAAGCAAGKYLQLKVQRRNSGSAAAFKAIVLGATIGLPHTLN